MMPTENDREKLMRELVQWPIYVTRDGVTVCNAGRCERPYFLEEFFNSLEEFSNSHSGTNLDWQTALMDHVIKYHKAIISLTGLVVL